MSSEGHRSSQIREILSVSDLLASALGFDVLRYFREQIETSFQWNDAGQKDNPVLIESLLSRSSLVLAQDYRGGRQRGGIRALNMLGG